MSHMPYTFIPRLLLVAASVSMALLVAFGFSTDAAGQEAESRLEGEKTLTLIEVDGSGVAGEVKLTESKLTDNQCTRDCRLVDVVINVTGLTSGESYFSGVYDSSATTCRDGFLFIHAFGGVFTTPEAVTGETATISYRVVVPLRDIFSVVVRKGDASPGTVVACAEDTETTTLPTTGSGGLLDAESGSVSWFTGAILLFALLGTGLAAVTIGRRWFGN